MPKKRKKRSVSHEDRSPLMKFKLNQQIKAAESRLSGDELTAFRQLSPADKRDVVLASAKQSASEAIDAEIIDYFKRLNPAG